MKRKWRAAGVAVAVAGSVGGVCKSGQGWVPYWFYSPAHLNAEPSLARVCEAGRPSRARSRLQETVTDGKPTQPVGKPGEIYTVSVRILLLLR